MSASTYLDLISLAYSELNISPGVGVIPSEDAQFALDRLTLMVDGWSVRPSLVPWYQQRNLPLTPGKQDYLIGLNSPDWDVPRPVKIEKDMAYVQLLSGAPPVNIPIAVLDATEWSAIPIQQLQITFPQALYYVRDIIVGTNLGNPYTAGTIRVWGIPTDVNNLVLTYRWALTVGNLDDDVNSPPAYFRCMMLNLALEIASTYGATPSDWTKNEAGKSRAEIAILNKPNMTAPMNAPGVRAGTYLTRAQFLSGQF